MAPADSSETPLVQLSYDLTRSRVLEAFLVGHPADGEFAVVSRSKTQGIWSCTGCSSNKKACIHVQAISGNLPRQKPAGLSQEDFEGNLLNYLSADRSSRRITSITQVYPEPVYSLPFLAFSSR